MTNKVMWGASLVCRLIAAAVFLYAGWLKLRTPAQFADNIAAYQLLPAQLINLCALSLPPLELIVGILLLTGWQRRAALFAALVMTSVFMAVLGSAIARGLTIDCGCFGSEHSTKLGLWWALIRDVLLAAVLLFAYCRELYMNEMRPDSGHGSVPQTQRRSF